MTNPTGTVPPSDPAMSRATAIVGVGETDYASDYAAARAKPNGYEAPTAEALAALAFERALVDAGLSRGDIDGLSVSFTYGGPSAEALAPALGLKPRCFLDAAGIMAGPLPNACAAIARGECGTVALVYAVASRSLGMKFGGHKFDGGGAPSSYFYHHPWGWSSQAAHWALAWRYYQSAFGKHEADLGEVALQLRRNAMANPNAIMRKALTIEDYLASRYIVRPLHLYDMCLVNDGGVCLIVTRADRARDLPHDPVHVAGWGSEMVTSDKLDALVRRRLAPQIAAASAEALGMAGLAPGDVQHLEAYDASTMHLVNQVEGNGFAKPGEGLDFFRSGAAAPSGSLPVNVAGGMLSGSYMHGWNHVAEIVRQLRHEGGDRQIAGAEVSLFSLAETDRVHPIVFTRGA